VAALQGADFGSEAALNFQEWPLNPVMSASCMLPADAPELPPSGVRSDRFGRWRMRRRTGTIVCMTITLSKGANTRLVDASDLGHRRFHLVVRWADPTRSLDLDVSVLLLGADGRVRSDEDLIFYNAPTGGDGAVHLLGKRVDDDGSGEDRAHVDLEALPPDVCKLAVAASLDAAPGTGFGALARLELVVADASGQELVQYPVVGAGSETAFVLAELYLRDTEWKCRAVGQGWDNGLAGLAADYGITVDEATESDESSEKDADLAEEPFEYLVDDADPRELSAEPADVPADSADAPGPIDISNPPEPLAAVLPLPRTAMPVEGAAPRSRPAGGVRTVKKRTTSSSLPTLTLAGDKNWQPARLFSVSGTGNAQEQEKRATSALLSTMMAVRDFGRGLVGRFGGPGGTVETYLEVPFLLGERTVYPDGVIRVARAGRVWTALLETKTGPHGLRVDQVENYLEVAKAQGFDAVVTLSNDLTPVGGDHPVAVDRRKLKKVTLHHISWSEVLHEARMNLDHRGVNDRAQAWILAELIRYLQDPRSGAAGFDDMGAAWVPVREAIAARTLRPTDKRISDVAVAWDKLVRHLCLRLTGQLGVTVAPVLPRALANAPAARVQANVTQLADDGRLSTTIRIPQAVGLLTVVADIRSGQVRTSVEIDAPREGGASRRLNWLLRQLKDAPDNLSVEVIVAKQAHTMCELLKDVRTSPAKLTPDPSADIRAFRLTLPSPLGTKRSGIRGAFIPSINAAVDAFYAQVVQQLRPWPSSPAKLPANVAEEAVETIEALDEADQTEECDGAADV
jgi:stress response protein SCP2